MTRLDAEITRLRKRFQAIEWDVERGWLVVKDVELKPGWNRRATDILIEIPPGYPSTPPDNFYTSPELRLSNGAMPANTSGLRSFGGAHWLQFSFHIEVADWRPHADIALSHTIETYMEGILGRLDECE